MKTDVTPGTETVNRLDTEEKNVTAMAIVFGLVIAIILSVMVGLWLGTPRHNPIPPPCITAPCIPPPIVVPPPAPEPLPDDDDDEDDEDDINPRYKVCEHNDKPKKCDEHDENEDDE